MILEGIFAAGVAIAIWILAQVVFLKFLDRRFHFRFRLFLYGVSLLGFLLLQWQTPPLNLFNGALLHLLLFCTFMEFYYYIDRPVTLRILVEAQKTPDRTFDLQGLYRSYDLDYMISKRLGILATSGYLFQKEGRYYLTPKGNFFAKIFDKGSKLFGVRQIG